MDAVTADLFTAPAVPRTPRPKILRGFGICAHCGKGDSCFGFGTALRRGFDGFWACAVHRAEVERAWRAGELG